MDKRVFLYALGEILQTWLKFLTNRLFSQRTHSSQGPTYFRADDEIGVAGINAKRKFAMANYRSLNARPYTKNQHPITKIFRTKSILKFSCM